MTISRSLHSQMNTDFPVASLAFEIDWISEMRYGPLSECLDCTLSLTDVGFESLTNSRIVSRSQLRYRLTVSSLENRFGSVASTWKT